MELTTDEKDPIRTARSLLLEASTALAQANAVRGSLHQPGVRDLTRQRLHRALALAQGALSKATGAAEEDTETTSQARWILIEAHAARAEDARYGAGQLSRGSQRAPTREDCEDGWQRVESIVLDSEAQAAAATRLALELADARAESYAWAARTSARRARQIVLDRNHAYTFHADASFSFGEGWYLAAAAVLDETVTIQVEPDRSQTEQARIFLEEAGLGARLVPHRPRPRANKPLPDLVARAFRKNANTAQAKLRAAFLGSQPVPAEIRTWTAHVSSSGAGAKKVLVWIRHGAHHPARNTDWDEVLRLCRIAVRQGLVPVLIGDGMQGGVVPEGALDMTLFWKLPIFQGPHMRRAQLQLFECLRQEHGLVGQMGVTTAGMDGPALMGLPTMYLTEEPNVRLGKWVGAVPGYQEVVRQKGYLDSIDRTLRRWALEKR